jgi:hypothetical protein
LASGYSEYTIHKDEQRKQRYIDKNKKYEIWLKSGLDSAMVWLCWLLWNLPTIKESYEGQINFALPIYLF